MKKKIIISFIFLVGLLILIALAFQFLINPVLNITERNGKFFDGSGKQLGYCKVETTLRKLDTEPSKRTFYYNSDESSIGYCEGDSTGSSLNIKSQPNICKPLILQGECDTTIHPKEISFCSKAKYKCVLDN